MQRTENLVMRTLVAVQRWNSVCLLKISPALSMTGWW